MVRAGEKLAETGEEKQPEWAEEKNQPEPRQNWPKPCGVGSAGIGRENQPELEGKLDRSREENQLELVGKTGQNLGWGKSARTGVGN